MTAALAGWIPAIILPIAIILQLYKILKTKKANDVSATTWGLYAIASFGAYIFTEKYLALQSILAFLLTAVLNLSVLGVTLYYQRKR